MEIVTLFILAIGLSFDSFAVSVSSGLVLPHIRFGKACIIAFSLAFFQALMPIIGWLAGLSIRNYLIEIDHWIAFVLLSVLGVKMMIESRRPEEIKQTINPLHPGTLLSMSVATSIDALIVGITFAFINTGNSPLWLSMLWPVLIIGSITFIVSMLGILFGKNIGSRFGQHMEMLGGIILIAIGAKILVEHLWF